MSFSRYVAPSLCLLLGLYGLIWGIVASSSPTPQRVGGAFLGVLFMLLALVYVRVIFPGEREEAARSDQVK